MDKCKSAVPPGSRCLVDQLHGLLLEFLQGLIRIGHLEGEQVKAFSATLNESRHLAVVVGWRHKFKANISYIITSHINLFVTIYVSLIRFETKDLLETCLCRLRSFTAMQMWSIFSNFISNPPLLKEMFVARFQIMRKGSIKI